MASKGDNTDLAGLRLECEENCKKLWQDSQFHVGPPTLLKALVVLCCVLENARRAPAGIRCVQKTPAGLLRCSCWFFVGFCGPQRPRQENSRFLAKGVQVRMESNSRLADVDYRSEFRTEAVVENNFGFIFTVVVPKIFLSDCPPSRCNSLAKPVCCLCLKVKPVTPPPPHMIALGFSAPCHYTCGNGAVAKCLCFHDALHVVIVISVMLVVFSLHVLSRNNWATRLEIKIKNT